VNINTRVYIFSDINNIDIRHFIYIYIYIYILTGIVFTIFWTQVYQPLSKH